MTESGIEISHNFMDTSPSNGVKSFHPYVKDEDLPDPASPFFGDGHYYYLTLDCED